MDAFVAERLRRALTAEKEELFSLLNDPLPEVVAAALRNRSLDENHLLALLSRTDLTEELLTAVYRLPVAETSHRVKVHLARNPRTPGAITLALLPHLYLFELVHLASHPGASPDQRVAAERTIVRRLPAVPLGNKMTLARRATPAVLEALLMEGDARIVDICLDNPRLPEGAVFRFLAGPRSTAETISAVARHPRWKNRPPLRSLMLKNPKTPPIWFTLYLPSLPPGELKDLAVSRKLSPLQKRAVEEELNRRGLRKGAR